MQMPVPEKLLNIVEDIDAAGSANLTRLTVLKKWFDRPERKTAFAMWGAHRATGRSRPGIPPSRHDGNAQAATR